jgi:hypothetical protein
MLKTNYNGVFEWNRMAIQQLEIVLNILIVVIVEDEYS